MGFETQAVRGVVNHYGPRAIDMRYGAQQNSDSIIKSAVWEFTYNTLPTPSTNGMQYVIPAGATIVSAKLYVDTAFTSTSTTTDLLIGLQKSDGTEIDNDGLIAAAQATQTAIATAGNVVTGAGALVGASIGSNAGELKVAGSDTDLLTGAGRIVVEYVVAK